MEACGGFADGGCRHGAHYGRHRGERQRQAFRG